MKTRKIEGWVLIAAIWLLTGCATQSPLAETRKQAVEDMVAFVEVRFVCDPQVSAEHQKLPIKTKKEGVEFSRKQYEKRAVSWNRTVPDRIMQISVTTREDLNMLEVLAERGKDTQKWEASYWPLNEDMIDFDGSLQGIRCDIRHDPIEKRYGDRGWRCRSCLRINKDFTAKIEIYVAHLVEMPGVFKQVKRLLIDSKR